MRQISSFLGSLIMAGTATQVSADSQAEFERTYADAEATRNQAASVGGEWRDVGKMLSEAKKAAAAGDLKKANDLATRALNQSQLGHQQALDQRNPDTLSMFGR